MHKWKKKKKKKEEEEEEEEDDMMIQIKKSNRDCTRHTCLASSQSLKIS